MTADPTASPRPIRTTAMGRPGGRIAAGALLVASSLAGGVVAEAGSASAAGTMTWSTPGTFPGTVPLGDCAITFTAVGGDGGADYFAFPGGAGGETTATVAVTPNESYSVSVGGKGGTGLPQPFDHDPVAGGAGGVGGGGAGGTDPGPSGFDTGGGGGGSSAVVIGSQLLIVAGGGGGAGGSADPSYGGLSGAAGGAADQPGLSGYDDGVEGGAGGGAGTPSGPGVGGGAGNAGTGPNGADPGLGGAGAAGEGDGSGGGGGGGYNGGGGGGSGGAENVSGGGGGGSDFGPAGAVLSPSPTSPVNAGNGQVTATFIACTPQTAAFTTTPASTTVGATYTPIATASTTPVTYTVDPATTNGACTLTAGVVTFTAAGNCVIDASAPTANGFAAGTATQTIAVTAAAPTGTGADLAVTLAAPATAADGTTFTATLTVTDNGPNPAANVVTGLNIPAGVTATTTSGARQIGPLLTWTAKTIPNGQNVTYTITYTVGSRTRSNALLAAAGASLTTRDPHLANNAATTRITLG